MSAPPVLSLLVESRRREKAQTLFYRSLAAQAEAAGDSAQAERLSELHADEQHHLSRLTARLLELGGVPADLRHVPTPSAALERWRAAAREREQVEVSWYEEALEVPLDPSTRALVEQILESERRHRAELGGKWMPA